MLQCAVRRTQHMAALGSVSVRYKTTRYDKKVIFQTGEKVVTSNQPAAWSTGKVIHPKKLDCPLGDKGIYPKPMEDGGLQYFGFQYYPRHPDEKDPPYQPTPLHMVTRVRSLLKKPWWDKEIMKKLGLDDKRGKVVILKNNPENNAMLYKVKHMVKVVPVHLPSGLMDKLDEVDLRRCFLKEDGQFVVMPTVNADDSALVEDSKELGIKFDREFITKYTRKNWQYPWQLKLC